ncbi:unnamed protein product [Angiostrongylus costaricensis]|uniref:Uncharacterized protein n=1 Tax=Angiostrongylus costaricensis TaxID=334426 RepID=A0A0R3PPN2_ANGCS|nr:unnamed protein product [Angiostrongylus costaricensis]
MNAIGGYYPPWTYAGRHCGVGGAHTGGGGGGGATGQQADGAPSPPRSPPPPRHAISGDVDNETRSTSLEYIRRPNSDGRGYFLSSEIIHGL